MPSAHTAFVVSLSTVIGLNQGWESAAFAIAVIFSLLIIRDALGIRQFLSQHSQILNRLIRLLPGDTETLFPASLPEHVGHTPIQAVAGGILGLLVAIGLYSVWPS